MNDIFVYFGESLQYLFNHIEIYIIIGNVKVNLFDYLPRLKQGYSTISSLRIILKTYIGFYGIDKIEENKFFEKAFGSDIPAEFFSLYLFETQIANYKKPAFFDDYLTQYHKSDHLIKFDKILMDEAIKQKYIINPMNTNNIMDFDGDYFDFGIDGYVDGIIFYNVYENNEEFIKDFVRKDINLENDIIRSIENVITNNNNEINLISLKYRIKNSFKKILLNDIDIKLFVAILFNDINKVILFLKDIDPRLYNNEAYHLAIKNNNKQIIKMIRNKIIELNWYEKLVFEYGLGVNIANDIYLGKL